MKFVGIIVLAVCSLLSAWGQEADHPNDEFERFAVTAKTLSVHQHSHASTAPMSLAELESAALASNPEIRAAEKQVAVAQARGGSAGSLDDPVFMYRAWG